VRRVFLGCTLACAACGDMTVTTTVRVRDPSAVAVQFTNERGETEVLLPPGREPLEVELPRTSPPYNAHEHFTASALRRGESGAIDLRCDACVGTPRIEALPSSGQLVLADTTYDKRFVPEVKGDALLIHVAYPYQPNRKGGPSTAFSVDLVTPTTNVAELRQKGGDLRGGGLTMLIVGLALTATGTVMLYEGTQAEDHARRKGLSFVGIFPCLTWGVPALLLSIPLLATPGGDKQILPRS
jgi:hypothetical protein